MLNVIKVLIYPTSATLDRISQVVYKKCALSLSKPLHIIFNISLSYSEVLESWKQFNNTAIPKNTNPELGSSYGLICTTPTPIEVVACIILRNPLHVLSRTKTIPYQQHGFMSGASTAALLSGCLFDWNLALNNGNCSIDVIYFELAKAFDKVDHGKLLNRLYQLRNGKSS